MTIVLLALVGSLGVTGTINTFLDPETARLLNSVVNLATLFLLYYHRRTLVPKVAKVEEKVEHLDDSLGAAVPGGRRHIDPPATPPADRPKD